MSGFLFTVTISVNQMYLINDNRLTLEMLTRTVLHPR